MVTTDSEVPVEAGPPTIRVGRSFLVIVLGLPSYAGSTPGRHARLWAPRGRRSRVTKTSLVPRPQTRCRGRKRKECCLAASPMGGRTQTPSAQPTTGHSERPCRHENRPHPDPSGPWFASAQARAPFRACAVLLRARQPRSPAPATPLPLSLWPITK